MVLKEISNYFNGNVSRLVALPLVAGALALASGCQTAQKSYMGDPQNSSFLVREAGKTQNTLDAALPRTYAASAERAGDSLSNVPGDLVYLATRPAAPFYEGDKSLTRRIAVAPLEIVGGTIKAAYSLVSDGVLTPATQAGNMAFVLPLTSDNPKIGATTDPITGPARTLLYLVASEDTSIPDSAKFGYSNIVGDKPKELLKFRKSGNSTQTDITRVIGNSVPFISPAIDKAWGTTYIQRGDDFVPLEKVPTHTRDGIPLGKLTLDDYSRVRALEEKGVGTVKQQKDGTYVLMPSESVSLSAGRGGKDLTLFSLILRFLSGNKDSGHGNNPLPNNSGFNNGPGSPGAK